MKNMENLTTLQRNEALKETGTITAEVVGSVTNVCSYGDYEDAGYGVFLNSFGQTVTASFRSTSREKMLSLFQGEVLVIRGIVSQSNIGSVFSLDHCEILEELGEGPLPKEKQSKKQSESSATTEPEHPKTGWRNFRRSK